MLFCLDWPGLSLYDCSVGYVALGRVEMSIDYHGAVRDSEETPDASENRPYLFHVSGKVNGVQQRNHEHGNGVKV